MRKRRKLKTYVKIILSLFIVLVISLILLLIFSKPKEKEKKVEKINYVELIIDFFLHTWYYNRVECRIV